MWWCEKCVIFSHTRNYTIAGKDYKRHYSVFIFTILKAIYNRRVFLMFGRTCLFAKQQHQVLLDDREVHIGTYYGLIACVWWTKFLVLIFWWNIKFQEKSLIFYCKWWRMALYVWYLLNTNKQKFTYTYAYHTSVFL